MAWIKFRRQHEPRPILASTSIDLQAHDTFFVVADLHHVLIGGAVFPSFGACYFWSLTDITGQENKGRKASPKPKQ